VNSDLFVFGKFRLDPAMQQFWRGNGLVLRPKLFAALQYLVENPGRLITREELLRAVWSRTHVDETRLRGTMRDLRALLGDDAESPKFIQTIPHQGCRFLSDVQRKRTSTGDAPAAGAKRQGGLLERESELGQLFDCATQTLARQRQLVFVTGEPGIGKTTLVDAYTATLSGKVLGSGDQGRRELRGNVRAWNRRHQTQKVG
jgi:DNA-binding winged helix-turn-helix (wHTH) protein